jgi:glucosamine 6-phosphate synthetase-like amidotransferase/phosphosugar isomerase protein
MDSPFRGNDVPSILPRRPRMETRSKILEIPRLLRDTLEKGLHEYETLIRHVRWGEAPLYICACGASVPLGVAGVYLFEWLTGWPAVARSAKVFEAYTVPALRPRAVLLVISVSGEDPDALEIARLARSRGAMPLAMTRHPDSPLARACEGVFLTRDEGADDSAAAAVCQLAALSLLALTTARILKRSSAGLEQLEDELKRLPAHLEWSFAQLRDALRSLAQELRALDRFWLVGGGLYHPVAARGAWRLSAFGGMHGEGIEISQFCSGPLSHLRRGETAMFVSGARTRIKRLVHQAAGQMKAKGAKLISLTDTNDRELVERSDIAILLPALSEVGGSLLTLAVLELLAAPETILTARD